MSMSILSACVLMDFLMKSMLASSTLMKTMAAIWRRRMMKTQMLQRERRHWFSFLAPQYPKRATRRVIPPIARRAKLKYLWVDASLTASSNPVTSPFTSSHSWVSWMSFATSLRLSSSTILQTPPAKRRSPRRARREFAMRRVYLTHILLLRFFLLLLDLFSPM